MGPLHAVFVLADPCNQSHRRQLPLFSTASYEPSMKLCYKVGADSTGAFIFTLALL